MRIQWITALAMLLTAGTVRAQTVIKFVHTDALGSVVTMTDADGAVVEGHREYEAYGQQLTPAVQDGPGYTGHVQDAATGLVYMQQRYYDPGIGRFLSVDPVTAYSNPVGAFNRYWYANNNPYKFIDPDGREVWGAYSNDSGSLFMVDLETKSAAFVRAESGGKPFGDPVPAGDYLILSRAGRDGFYRLERRDSNFGDDRTPEGRSLLRLHGPGRTTGCISVCEPGPFRGIDGMLKRTSTSSTQVDDKSWRGRITGAKETLANFGTMRVLPSGVSLNVSKSGEVSARWTETGSRIVKKETLCTIKDGKCQ